MNKATRINVATLGTIFGISGINHGFFETLQGNVPTPGLFIFAIGEAQKMWLHGDEPAFTIIPNFLLTGYRCHDCWTFHHHLVAWFRSQEEWTNCFHPSLHFASFGWGWCCADTLLPIYLACFNAYQSAAGLVAKGSTHQSPKVTRQSMALVPGCQCNAACMRTHHCHYRICTRCKRSGGSIFNYANLPWNGSSRASVDFRVWICTRYRFDIRCHRKWEVRYLLKTQ